MCTKTYQSDATFNPNPNPNPNHTTKQHAVVNIQLNIVTGPTFIRDSVVPFVLFLRFVIIFSTFLFSNSSVTLNFRNSFRKSSVLIRNFHLI